MKISFLPKTRLGKQAVIFFVSSWVLFLVGELLPSKEGLSGWENVIQNPIHTLLTVLILVAGIAAPVMSLIAVIKKQERSILVFLIIPTIISSIIMFIGVFMNMVLGMTL